jgi:hypothetical protein
LSDINITITWQTVAFGMLAYAFWPITVVTALAVGWWWLRRASWPARIIAMAAGALWIASAFADLTMIAARARDNAAYQSDLRSRQSTLSPPSTIAGIRLPVGTVVTHDNMGTVEAVDVPTATEIRGVPVIGHVGLSSGQLDGEMKLARDARVGEAICSSHDIVRFQSGKLAECQLAMPSKLSGIPCTGHVQLLPGVVCELSGNYQRFGYLWRAQTNVTDFGDTVWFGIGAQPPSLLVFGSTLPAQSQVQFQHGTLASVDLRTSPTHYRGCAFNLILVQNHKVLGMTTGACSIPNARNSMYVALPSTTLGRD